MVNKSDLFEAWEAFEDYPNIRLDEDYISTSNVNNVESFLTCNKIGEKVMESNEKNRSSFIRPTVFRIFPKNIYFNDKLSSFFLAWNSRTQYIGLTEDLYYQYKTYIDNNGAPTYFTLNQEIQIEFTHELPKTILKGTIENIEWNAKDSLTIITWKGAKEEKILKEELDKALAATIEKNLISFNKELEENLPSTKLTSTIIEYEAHYCGAPPEYCRYYSITSETISPLSYKTTILNKLDGIGIGQKIKASFLKNEAVMDDRKPIDPDDIEATVDGVVDFITKDVKLNITTLYWTKEDSSSQSVSHATTPPPIIESKLDSPKNQYPIQGGGQIKVHMGSFSPRVNTEVIEGILPEETKTCTCPIEVIMTSGCKCGGQ